MNNFEVESHLKDALINKFGNYCVQCERSEKPLRIEHIYGQKELEKEFFSKAQVLNENMDYEVIINEFYLHNFDYESKFIGLVCNSCKISHSKSPKTDRSNLN